MKPKIIKKDIQKIDGSQIYLDVRELTTGEYNLIIIDKNKVINIIHFIKT